MNVLILTVSPKNFSTTKIVSEAEKKGHKVTVWNYLDMHINTSNSSGHHQIYHKGERIYRGKFDVIIPRIAKQLAYGSEILDMLVNYLHIPSIVQPEALRVATNKWRTALVLAQNGILSPKTTKLHRFPKDLNQLAKSMGGFPLIAKSEQGSQGKGVMILETENTAKTVLETMINDGQSLLLQEFVNTSQTKRKQDIRVWVIDGKVIGAYKRYSGDKGDPRTNYSLNKEGAPIELTDQEKQIAIKTAKVTGLEAAAIDLGRCIKTGKVYVYEVNGNGSLKGFTTVTGINLAFYIVDYAEKVAKGIDNQFSEITELPENFTKIVDGIEGKNTEIISFRISPEAKQQLEHIAEKHDYEGFAVFIRSLLFNSANLLQDNTQKGKTIDLLKKELGRINGDLLNSKTLNHERKSKLLQSIYLGNYKVLYDELSSDLKEQFEAEALPLLLLNYFLENDSRTWFLGGLERQQKKLEELLQSPKNIAA